VLARTIGELAALARAGRSGPRLFLTWGELEPAFESCESQAVELLERGRLLPVWNGAEEQFAGPGCVRSRGDRSPLACQGAAALNLVRLARRAGPWREDALMEELHALLVSAFDALERLDAFQSELRGAHVEILRERSSFALVPVGLAEASRILGDGECRPEQGGRLLGFLADAAARMAERRGLSLVHTPFFGGRARMRFAALDARTRRSRSRVSSASCRRRKPSSYPPTPAVSRCPRPTRSSAARAATPTRKANAELGSSRESRAARSSRSRSDATRAAEARA
jgi:hypothetical protein